MTRTGSCTTTCPRFNEIYVNSFVVVTVVTVTARFVLLATLFRNRPPRRKVGAASANMAYLSCG